MVECPGTATSQRLMPTPRAAAIESESVWPWVSRRSRPIPWTNATCPVCQGPARPKHDTMDGFGWVVLVPLRFTHAPTFAGDFDEVHRCSLPVDQYVGVSSEARTTKQSLIHSRFLPDACRIWCAAQRLRQTVRAAFDAGHGSAQKTPIAAKAERRLPVTRKKRRTGAARKSAARTPSTCACMQKMSKTFRNRRRAGWRWWEKYGADTARSLTILSVCRAARRCLEVEPKPVSKAVAAFGPHDHLVQRFVSLPEQGHHQRSASGGICGG